MLAMPNTFLTDTKPVHQALSLLPLFTRCCLSTFATPRRSTKEGLGTRLGIGYHVRYFNDRQCLWMADVMEQQRERLVSIVAAALRLYVYSFVRLINFARSLVGACRISRSLAQETTGSWHNVQTSGND